MSDREEWGGTPPTKRIEKLSPLFQIWACLSLCQRPHPSLPHFDSFHVATHGFLPPDDVEQVPYPLPPPQRVTWFPMLYHPLILGLFAWNHQARMLPGHVAIIQSHLRHCVLLPRCHPIPFKLYWYEWICESTAKINKEKTSNYALYVLMISVHVMLCLHTHMVTYLCHTLRELAYHIWLKNNKFVQNQTFFVYQDRRFP